MLNCYTLFTYLLTYLRLLTSERDVDVDSRHCAAVFDWCRAHADNVLHWILVSRTSCDRSINTVQVVVRHLRRVADLELAVDGRPGLLVAVRVGRRLGGREAQTVRLGGDVEASAT